MQRGGEKWEAGRKKLFLPPCGGERRGAVRRRHLGELRKNSQPTKRPNFSTPRTPTVRAAVAAAVVKNVMKPREGEDGYESHPQRVTAMPPQRSSRTRSDPRAGGRGERRSSPPSGRANESPREEWGARRPHAWRRRAGATRPWRGRELLLRRTGRSRTCGGPAATASWSAQGVGAAGGRGRRRLRIAARPRSRAYEVRERKRKRGYSR
jgi:hypothetical protein